VNTPPGGSEPDARAAVLERFGDWHAPIRELVEATPVDAIQRLDILDRPPRLPWHVGRVVLVVDSAHATTPNLSVSITARGTSCT
jgi:2-polyprenyl-6-methoxyphenol hydroxylase-like FAD-dependent oxidoreductase